MNSSAEWCCKIPIFGSIINNPFFTALLITVLVLIVIVSIYKVQEQGGQKLFKCGFYIFILVVAVTFLHHYTIMQIAKNNFANNEVKSIFSGIKQSKESAYDIIPIIDPHSTSHSHSHSTSHSTHHEKRKKHRHNSLKYSTNSNDSVSISNSNDSNSSNSRNSSNSSTISSGTYNGGNESINILKGVIPVSNIHTYKNDSII